MNDKTVCIDEHRLILSLYFGFKYSYQNSYIRVLLISNTAYPTAIGLSINTSVFLISIAIRLSEKTLRES